MLIFATFTMVTVPETFINKEKWTYLKLLKSEFAYDHYYYISSLHHHCTLHHGNESADKRLILVAAGTLAIMWDLSDHLCLENLSIIASHLTARAQAKKCCYFLQLSLNRALDLAHESGVTSKVLVNNEWAVLWSSSADYFNLKPVTLLFTFVLFLHLVLKS